MKRSNSLLVVFFFGVLVGACGDEEIGSPSCLTMDQCEEGQICVDGACLTPAATTGSEPGSPDTGSVSDTTPPADTKPPAPDTKPTPDTGPAPDLMPDSSYPELLSVTPADGAESVSLPFLVVLKFSEPVKNVDTNTVSIRDVNGEELVGTYSQNVTGDTHTFAPSEAGLLLSPYSVTVNYPIQVIMDFAGNKMQGIIESSFFTEAPDNLAAYDRLAARYAPVLHAETQSASEARFNVPTHLNLDGDWDVKDNEAYLSDANTKTVIPAVHHSVLESESHYFIHYTFYYPLHTEEAGGDTFVNDASGSLVVIEKWPQERPVEVLTWFRNGSGQNVRAFPTTESGISEGDNTNEAIDGVKAQNELFPASHYEAWLPGGIHESCLWNDGGQGSFGCELSSGLKPFIETYMLAPEPVTCVTDTDCLDLGACQAGALSGCACAPTSAGPRCLPTCSENLDCPTVGLEPGQCQNSGVCTPLASTVQKNGTKWPVTGSMSYALVDMLSAWWPKRTQQSDVFWNSSSTVVVEQDPDLEASIAFPRFFLGADGSASDGRAPWAVVWKPGDNSPYTEMPQGTFFMDPVTFLATRHKTAYFTTAFSADTKTGFSTIWCFHPYAGIDRRGTSELCP